MSPEEYSYYSDRMTEEERAEYLDLVIMMNRKIISEGAFNIVHNNLWKTVKERVDKQEQDDFK